MGSLAEMIQRSRQLDLARVAGVVLLATATMLIQVRKDGDWDEFALLLLALIPTSIAYVLILAVVRRDKEFEHWQTALSLTGILVGTVALVRLFQMFGAAHPTPGSGVTFLITAIITAIAAYTAYYFQSPVHTFVASLTFITCFFALIDWAGTDLTANTVRDILAAFLVAYWIGAYALRTYLPDLAEDHSRYLVFVGGVSGIYAAIAGAGASVAQSAASQLGGGSADGGGGWKFFLVAVSLLLIVYAVWQPTRPATWLSGSAGVFGLLYFIGIEGVAGIFKHEIGGWAIVLLIFGLILIAASVSGPQISNVIEQRSGAGGPSPPPTPTPPPPQEPPGSGPPPPAAGGP